MIARLIIVPVIVLGFAVWINQVNFQITGKAAIPEIVAVGGGYAGHWHGTPAPVLLAQGQLMFQ